jgi:threonine aldolase
MDASPLPAAQHRYVFASDNTAGICPEAWAALTEANRGQCPSYGNDAWTQRACDLIRGVFEKPDAEIFFVFNGTAANSLALASLCQSYHSVICHEFAHIDTDECGAPEFFSNGTKLLTARTPGGKLTPAAVERLILKRTDVHYPKPRVLSLTQTTEWGTLYTRDEIAALTEVARRHGLAVHMDGARFANAAASLAADGLMQSEAESRESGASAERSGTDNWLPAANPPSASGSQLSTLDSRRPASGPGVRPADFTWRAGVDVLCFGGTKNGMNTSEAVVFFNPALAREFDYRCKQAGQLASKMRFLSSQWVGVLQDGAWLRHAQHANRLARQLASALRATAGVSLLTEPEANAVFVQMPPSIAETLQRRGWHFYNFIGENGYRLMCSWDTREADIRDFIADLRTALGAVSN